MTTASPPLRDLTPAPAVAAAYFRAKLSFETDVADIAVALGYAPGGAPAWADAGFVVVDTRSRAAWGAGHLPGAVHVPTAQIPARAAEVAADGSTVVTYCWGPGCNGATRGALAFASAGFPVREMLGGFEYWAREGFPVETAAGRHSPAPDPLVVACGC